MDIMTLTPDENGQVEWPALSPDRRAVVTVGVFDGMHQGHAAVIGKVVELAKQTDSFAVVVLFDPRPGLVHRYAAEHDGAALPEDAVDVEALTGVDQRLRIMRDLGVDVVLQVRYSLPFAAKSYRFFLGQMVGRVGMRTLVLGTDAAMGNNREGDIKAIDTLAQATGVFELVVVDDRGPGEVRIPADAHPEAPTEPGEPQDPTAGMTKAQLRAWSKRHQGRRTRAWSSTNVRYLLGHGRIKDANAILGRPHAVEGVVVHGEERGRALGFPTANLGERLDGYLPVDGVYAGWLVDLGPAESHGPTDDATCPASERVDADSADAGRTAPRLRPYDDHGAVARCAADSPYRWPAAISIGTKPTFSEQTGLHERVAEAYAITEDGSWLDLYGHRVRFEFAGFLHPMVRYDGVDELIAALNSYVDQTRRLTA